MDIGFKVLRTGIGTGIEFLADCAQVHGLLDDIEIVGQIEGHWIDWDHEGPIEMGVGLFHQLPQN